MKRIFLVAGESSGDAHGAALVRALRAAQPDIVCEGLGGAAMAGAGMTLHHDLAGQAIMGFSEVFRQILPLRRLFLETVARLRDHPPECLVLIDYPGFNIRLARRARALGIPVVYYISPQVWAWKRGRIHILAQCVNKMLVIFPFEERLYRDAGVDCVFVGHPLLDHLAAWAPTPAAEEMVIGLLPGSRRQEIARLMDVMIAVARGIRERHPRARFVTPCVNAARAEQVRALAGDFPLDIRVEGMYDVLAQARFCLVASGTATLETALFGVPMIILYRVGTVNYWLARWFIRGIQHIGIVNILAGRGIVPEFLQHDAAPERILPAALELIEDTPARVAMVAELGAVRRSLGGPGASERAAREILACMEEVSHGR